MSIWDEAELVETPIRKQNIWDEAELIQETPQPKPVLKNTKKQNVINQTDNNLTTQNNTPLTPETPIQKPTRLNLTEEEKALRRAEVAKRFESEYAKIDAEYKKEMAKNIIGLGLEIGSSFIPVGAGAKLALTGAKLAKPLLTNVLKNHIKQGAKQGLASGAVFGAGRGLLEDKNIVETMAQDALTGGLIGSGGGLVSGKLAQNALKKGVKNVNNNPLKNNIPEEKLNNKQNTLTENLEQPTKTNLNTLKTDINTNKFEKGNLKDHMVTNKGKKGYYTSIADPASYNMELSQRDFNKIITEISKNPAKINDEAYLNTLENRVQEIIDKTPYGNENEVAMPYWEKFWNAIEAGNRYNEFKATPKIKNLSRVPYNALKENIELKPSKLKSTMQGAKALPNELKSKKIDYEVLHNPQLIKNANDAIASDASAVQNDLIRKARPEKGEKPHIFTADEIVKARMLVSKLYDEGKTQEAVDLTEDIIRNASQTGQALQAYTLWAKTTPDGAIAYAQKMLDKYNKAQNKNLKLSSEQASKIRELAENVQKTVEGTRENQIAVGLLNKHIAELTPKTWQKKYDTYRYINMLLSPKSRFKDVLLTGLNSADTAIDEVIASGLDKVRTTLFPNQQRAFAGLGIEPRTWGNAFKQGWQEGVEDVRLGINTSRSGEKGRYGLPKIASFNNRPLNTQNSLWGKIGQAGENVLANAEKVLNYSIQVPDRAFYEARFASSLKNQMKALGITEPTDEMIEQASKEALESVFQDNSWVSNLGEGTRKLFNRASEVPEQWLNMPQGSLPRVGNFIMPFVTTPANIVNAGIKNTVGAIGGIPKLLVAKTLQDRRNAELLLARNIKGLAPLGIGLGIGNGAIKSNIGSEDYKSDAVTGLQPQSIVLNGNNAISLKDYPQWNIPISAGAGFAQGGLPQATANLVKAVGDISSLKAVGDTLDAFKSKYGEQPTTAEVASNMARSLGTNIISQNIPFGGTLGYIRNITDPYARELYVPKGETNKEILDNTKQYVANRLQNRIPFASQELPLKYNAIGEPIRNNLGANIDNPLAEAVVRGLGETFDFGVRNYNENPLYDNLADFKESIKDTNYSGKTRVGLHTPSRSITLNGEKVNLNNKQYSDYSADYTKLNYKLNELALNSPDFNNMDDAGKTKYLSDLRKSVEEAVKIMQFGYEPKKKMQPYTQYLLDNYFSLLNE